MKSLRFTELLLLSSLHKRARRVKFHPKVTVVRGDNETGKSVLLRSIYESLGATAKTVPERGWTAAEVKKLLRFEVGNRSFSVLNDGESYTFLDAKQNVLRVFRRVTGDMAAWMADVFNFRLVFSSPSGGTLVPHPAYLFAPFYVDQLHGWLGPWSSLRALRTSRRKDALEYHVGIRPNEYFTAKARLQELRDRLRDPEVRLKALENVLANLDTRLGIAEFQIDEVAYRDDIERLLRACGDLKTREEAFRDELVVLDNERLSLSTQLGIIDAAAREFAQDYEYAVQAEHLVHCPTCGADYENSVAATFSIAQDEDRCVAMVSQLRDRLSQIEEKIQTAQTQYSSVSAELADVTKALAVKQGELTFREVIQAEGKREVRALIATDTTAINAEIDDLTRQIREARNIVRQLNDRARRTEIMNHYATAMSDVAVKLGVSPLAPEMLSSIDPKITGGGSDLPRRMLTYYAALLRLIRRHSSGTYCPFVADSVNQQDQSTDNLSRMLELLATGLPDGTQLVVGCVNTRGVRFDGSTIELTEKYGLLRTEEFADVVPEFRSTIDKRLLFEQKHASEAE
jgi:predicted  nucleic acid-binding Zn-ribbon protein